MRIRLVEEKIIELYSDLIQSPVHLSIGQEAGALVLTKDPNLDDCILKIIEVMRFIWQKVAHAEFFAELMGEKIRTKQKQVQCIWLHPNMVLWVLQLL